jgi:hypothetical protein
VTTPDAATIELMDLASTQSIVALHDRFLLRQPRLATSAPISPLSGDRELGLYDRLGRKAEQPHPAETRKSGFGREKEVPDHGL